MRKTQFQTGQVYHVFNRGTDKRIVFDEKSDFIRFLTGLENLNQPEPIISLYHQHKRKVEPGVLRDPLVEIIAYCLNPNHFHLLLRQLVEGGISLYMQKISQAYTKYYNYKNDRSGVLFQGPFKVVLMKSDEQLLYTAAYVNCNAEIHGIAKADAWPWSSNLAYLGREDYRISVDKKVIMKEFAGLKEYSAYCKDVIGNAQKIKGELRSDIFER